MTSPDGRKIDVQDDDARLANSATLLTLVCLCSLLLALMAMPLTFQHTDRLAPRIAASAPLALGVGVGFMARAARAQLRAHREEKDATREEGSPSGSVASRSARS